MAKIKTFNDYDYDRLDKEINEFIQDKKLIDIKTNVIIAPANGFIDSRGYNITETYNYIVIYEDIDVEMNPYKADNEFMEEYFKNNPL